MVSGKKKTVIVIIILIVTAFFGYIILQGNTMQMNDNGNNEDNLVDDRNNDGISTDDQEPIDKEEDDQEPVDEVLYDSGIVMDIEVHDDDVRTKEKLRFTVDNVPDNSNITWEMGDNCTLYGHEVIHEYRYSAYYHINVTAIWDDQYSTGSIQLGVKNRDGVSGYRSTSEKLLIGDPTERVGVGIQKGISIPDMEVSLRLSNLTGDLDIGVTIYELTEEFKEIDELRREKTEGKLSEHLFTWNISKEELSDHENIWNYTIYCWLEWTSYFGYVEWDVKFILRY